MSPLADTAHRSGATLAGAHSLPTEAPMLDATQTLGPAPASHRRSPRRKPAEYRLYYAIVFAVALPIALVGRLFPRRLTETGDAEASRSVWAEARALTDAVIPYLFMG